MYFSTPVKVPAVSGKIVRKKQGACTYVLFETERVYDPKRRFNVPKRVIIGKLLSDGEDDLMLPNERFLKHFPDAQLSPSEPPSKRSGTLRAGTYLAFAAIIKEYGLDKLLEASFGDKAGFILDLASYLIVSEDNAGQYYPDYARCHPLFTADMRILSDSTVSRFLAGIERDQITGFLDNWNAQQDHRQRIYISYDSTNKNSQAGDLDFVEFGHAKDDQGLPIVNVSLAFDKTNQVPLFYEVYPSSIPDVSQLRYLIEKIIAYNYHAIGIVLDRGYFSRCNIEFMDQKGIEFLMMVKGCKPLVSSLIEEKRNTFETLGSCRMPGSNVYGTTIKQPLFVGDTKERYFHLFHNPAKMAAERAEFDGMLDQMTEELQKLQGTECEIGAPFTRYFNCHYLDKKFVFAEEKTDVIRREHELCGYFCIVSSTKMTAAEAYHLYRGRDVSEKIFRADKTFLGSRSQRVHSSSSMHAKIFIEFVALIVRNRFYNLLKEQMLRLKTRRNTMTVPGAIRELEKIEMTRRFDSQYLLDFALTKNQKMIFQSFGLSAEAVTAGARSIAAKLAQTKDEKVLDEDAEGSGGNAETEIDCID